MCVQHSPSMSRRFNLVPNADVIPVVKSDVFKGHEDKMFVLYLWEPDKGLAYLPGSIEEAYLKLRANVYVDQVNDLSPEHRRVDGTEIDFDDSRSAHFIVCENLLSKIAVIGSMRLIKKTTNNLLPIERFFPEAFIQPITLGSVEVSRFIVRHNSLRKIIQIEKMLIAAGLAHLTGQAPTSIYGVIEPILADWLNVIKLPFERIAQPRFISYYNTVNLGIEIGYDCRDELIRYREKLGAEKANNDFYYWGTVDCVGD